MSFKFPRLASLNASKLSSQLSMLSVSVLTLSMLGGCSSMPSSQSISSKGSSEVAVSDGRDPYDAYYGSPATKAYDEPRYRTKIERKVIKPVFKTTAPKRYVVKKGDTMWGISQMFLNNPSYWPEIWDENQKVKNPHLIYPGDVLHIYQGGRRRIKMSDGRVVEKMVPQMRIERTGKGDPISSLLPFLAWPRVIDDDIIKETPYIVDGRDAHMLIEEGQRVYIKNLNGSYKQDRYAVFRPGKELRDPATNTVLGREVIYNGFVDIARRGAEVATADVIETKREIRPGDRLFNIENEEQSLNAIIRKPTHRVRGEIISLFEASMVSGQAQVVTINKGKRHGMKPGYILGVYAPGRTVDDPYKTHKRKYSFSPETKVQVGLPPERSATAVVYKVENNLSYALLTKSSHAVRNGYKIGNP
ncbi:MAG TPA: LysM peptidoglycan-binding domain-containing protein [Leucothrix mucor]|nr:LysM peptidoglycan-binding domain-containing protein [Leucothrix mucor]